MSDLTDIFIEALGPSCLRLYSYWIACGDSFAEELMANDAPDVLTIGDKYPRRLQFNPSHTYGYLFHAFPSHMVTTPDYVISLDNFEIPRGFVVYLQELIKRNVIMPPVLYDARNTKCRRLIDKVEKALIGASPVTLRRFYNPSIIYLHYETDVWRRFWELCTEYGVYRQSTASNLLPMDGKTTKVIDFVPHIINQCPVAFNHEAFHLTCEKQAISKAEMFVISRRDANIILLLMYTEGFDVMKTLSGQVPVHFLQCPMAREQPESQAIASMPFELSCVS